VVGLLAAAGLSQAWYRSPALYTPLGYAPDACGPGFYTVCPNGIAFGPNYCVYPPFPPFNGILPPEKAKLLDELQGRGIYQYGKGPGYSPAPGYTPYGVPLPNPGYSPPMPAQQPPAFPSHPFARGPRDFFMWGDVMQDKIARAQRPSLVP
jgi:hypothetical protein